MATAKVNGVNYTIPPNRSNSGAGGNGGASTKIGSGSSNLLDNVVVSYENLGVFGSTVLDNDVSDKALASGVFAYDNESPIAKKLTTTLSTVNNTVLRSGACQPALIRSIHRQEKVTSTRFATAFRAGYFSLYTGKYTTTPTTATDPFWDIGAGATSSTSTDQAATPTREVPGELVYKLGKPEPVLVDYEEKTN
jgi:hypothetical protein